MQTAALNSRRSQVRCLPRLGAATLDYVLLLGVIFPLVAFAIPSGKRIIQLTYELICTLIAWPLM